jgi:hypothetical protein
MILEMATMKISSCGQQPVPIDSIRDVPALGSNAFATLTSRDDAVAFGIRIAIHPTLGAKEDVEHW